jgi:hypothetical protein
LFVAVLSASISALERLVAVDQQAQEQPRVVPAGSAGSDPASGAADPLPRLDPVVVQFHQAMAEYGGCSAPLRAPAALPCGQVRQSNTCY